MRTKISLLAAIMSATFMTQAMAQGAAPVIPGQDQPVPLTQDFLNVPGIAYEGKVSGDDVWSIPDEDFFVIRDQETGNYNIGYLFSDSGEDLLASYRQSGALTIGEIVGVPTAGEDEAVVAAPQQEQSTDAIEPGLIEDDNALLEAAPEGVRNELLAKLVERLSVAQTREEYERTILEWRTEVRNQLKDMPVPDDATAVVDQLMEDLSSSRVAAPQVSGPDTLLAPVVPESPQPQAPPAETVMPSGQENVPNAFQQGNFQLGAVGEQPQTENTAATDAANEIFSIIAERSNWFSVGSPAAPVVYMVVDPSCPYCSEALVNLRPEVESGRMQLRVIPAALLSQTSVEVLAGIMLSPNPAEALFLNAAAKRGAPGGKEVVKRSLSDMPQELQEDLNLNQQNVISLGLTKIPFFVWKTEAGVQTFNEVPMADVFVGALPEEPR